MGGTFVESWVVGAVVPVGHVDDIVNVNDVDVWNVMQGV